jgi:uncharacterized repeat protein (TIGR03806 family)
VNLQWYCSFQSLFIILSGFIFATTSSAECKIAGNPTTAAVELTEMISGLDRPIKVASIDQRLLIVEQPGKVKSLKNGESQATLILNLQDRVTAISPGGDERGLLGMAIHPRTSNRVFLSYTTREPLRSRISEFRYDLASNRIDPASESIILELPQPFSNHNGGDIAFGKDGMLYIAFGDGGSGNDPQGNGQSLNTLLGKILRIDIDHAKPYTIPTSNPFANRNDAKKEIFAYGLRNPWRFSFDRLTGELWAGDVGQGKYEEIDLIESGKNYGWNTMEGKHCLRGNTCNTAGLTLPVHEYGRADGFSVTGGFVYRGTKIPSLNGKYVFGDFGSGKIWALANQGNGNVSVELLLESQRNISSFGEDQNGELLVLDHRGSVLRLATKAQVKGDSFPFKISETGCFSSLNPLIPAEGVHNYEVNSPLWSDGLEKSRLASIPLGSKIKGAASGRWEFPDGSVFIKNFFLPSNAADQSDRQIVETRFLVKRSGQFIGYSYLWNEGQTEASYIPSSVSREFVIKNESGTNERFSYTYPSSADCNRCHTEGGNKVLGFNQQQLDRDLQKPDGSVVDQLEHFVQNEILEMSLASNRAFPKMVSYRNPDEHIDLRAKSYLTSNCSYCHNAETRAGQLSFDFRWTASLRDMGVCNVYAERGSFNIPDAQIVRAGDANQSVLYQRVKTHENLLMMPPLGHGRVDTVATTVLEDWINQLADCDQ